MNSAANELRRLMKGVGKRMTHGIKTVFLVERRQVPAGRTVNYAKCVVETHPLKTEVELAQITVGGKRIEYQLKFTTPIV